MTRPYCDRRIPEGEEDVSPAQVRIEQPANDNDEDEVVTSHKNVAMNESIREGHPMVDPGSNAPKTSLAQPTGVNVRDVPLPNTS